MEQLAWRQIRAAYGVRMKLVPLDFPTMEEALDSVAGKKVFMIPEGRTDTIDFDRYKIPKDQDVVFVFGKPGDNLVRYITDDDDAVSIHTPNNVDMMAISVAGTVLNGIR
jgi:hypothetical protein